MNVKRKSSKLMRILFMSAISFSLVLPTYAASLTSMETAETVDSKEAFDNEEITDNEKAINNEEGLDHEIAIDEEKAAAQEADNEEIMDIEDTTVFDDILYVQADDEIRYEEIEVDYVQPPNYFVTIPKKIVLGADKTGTYSVKVEGDIMADQQVCVVPVDGISGTEIFDFYMKDQTTGSSKEDVIAEVNQAKFYWSSEEIAAGYEENDNYIIAEKLSAGNWRGIFQMKISMTTDSSHVHNYVGKITKEATCIGEGEKNYTCDCGESYIEKIEAAGHHYAGGECGDCGEKDAADVAEITVYGSDEIDGTLYNPQIAGNTEE